LSRDNPCPRNKKKCGSKNQYQAALHGQRIISAFPARQHLFG